MDLIWIKRGFFGRNKCLVPKGNPYSARFDSNDKYFQSWVGTYFLTSLFNRKFNNKLERVYFLSNAAIEDQNMWLRSYGYRNPKSFIIKDSIKLISEQEINGFKQEIYYGEMQSGIDDSIYNKFDIKLFHLISVLSGEIYSGVKMNIDFLSKDDTPTNSRETKLFGYYSLIEIKPYQYMISYVCGSVEYKNAINKELLGIINNLEVVPT
jgi:hypothetical protein